MSEMKNFQNYCEKRSDDAYQASYQISYQMMVLANLAWHNGTSEPVWAPSLEWIKESRTLLKEAINALNELEAAQDVLVLSSDREQ